MPNRCYVVVLRENELLGEVAQIIGVYKNRAIIGTMAVPLVRAIYAPMETEDLEMLAADVSVYLCQINGEAEPMLETVYSVVEFLEYEYKDLEEPVDE